MQEFDRFMEVVRELRKKCPWDSVQTHESLKPYLMEEAGEVLEGIDHLNAEGDSPESLRGTGRRSVPGCTSQCDRGGRRAFYDQGCDLGRGIQDEIPSSEDFFTG